MPTADVPMVVPAPAPATERFAVVEQMGHRRVVGRVSEVEVCGVQMLRVETLSTPPLVTTVHPQSLYGITDCTEAHARRAAGRDYSPLGELEAPDDGVPGSVALTDDASDGGPEDRWSDGEGRLTTHPCPECRAAADEPCAPGCRAGEEA